MIACGVMRVLSRRSGLRRSQHEGRHAQFLKIVQFIGEASEVADAVTVTVAERSDVQFIENRIFVPLRIHCLPRDPRSVRRTALAPERLCRALQYSNIAHTLRGLLALT